MYVLEVGLVQTPSIYLNFLCLAHTNSVCMDLPSPQSNLFAVFYIVVVVIADKVSSGASLIYKRSIFM